LRMRPPGMTEVTKVVAIWWLVLVVSLPSTLNTQILDRAKMTPCKFNPFCLCSNNGDDLGAVECSDVAMADLPAPLEDTRVFALTLRGNGLRKFPVGKLRGMGVWSLEISQNKLHSLPSLAFSGLERSLWHLLLSKNQFTRIPSDSISRLKKLNTLDLSDNQISDIEALDLKSLSGSLVTLVLAGNSLTAIPEGVFWNLKMLTDLDLSRNNIINLHSMAFKTGLPVLSHLDLSENLLTKIPFSAVAGLKSLKRLDFSRNRIERVEDTFSKRKLNLDQLLLEENNIEELGKLAFTNFKRVNRTSLKGNPLDIIRAGAFLDTRVRSLNFRNCKLKDVQSGAFRGLERSLEVLDMGSNHLSILSPSLLDDFDNIKQLRLGNNMLALRPNNTFSSFKYSIEELELSGEHMQYVPMRELAVMKTLRKLSLASVRDYGNLRLSQFEEFHPGLEELSLTEARIKVIRDNAFYHIPSLSRLDLTGNKIVRIEDSAFREIGKSLKELILRHSLHLHELPNIPFQALQAITTLDLSDNHIRTVPLDTFHKMKELKELFLQDNEIESFQVGTFHSQANHNLQVLDLSFNRIRRIEYDMFRFENLRVLHLDDNQIEQVDSKSFVDMGSLNYLSLEGNRISRLADETFQNLHNLKFLNLAFNRLTEVNFDALDYVGSLSFLNLDLSHNKLERLASNKSSNYQTNSNIRVVLLNHNSISEIQPGFFDPVNTVVKILDLSHNDLSEVTVDGLGGLRRLKSLDLSSNRIETFMSSTLEESRELLQLNLSHNLLSEIGAGCLHRQHHLQLLDLSHNRLTSLPESLLQKTRVEIFKVSFNALQEIPVKTLNPVQSSLRHLDLSHNNISLISDSLLNQIQQLVTLDLGYNNIYQIDDRAFSSSPSLLHLSLAHNPIKVVSLSLFAGLEQQLETLDMANTSLTILPQFHLPALSSLNMSCNKLTFVPSSALANMTGLRTLDLSNNYLPSPPHMVWHIMPRLRHLSLARNPIQSLANDSFLSLDRLEHLDLSNMKMESIEKGTFLTLPSLAFLKISVGGDSHLPDINLARLLVGCVGLRHIHLVLESSTIKLRHTLQHEMQPRLNKVTLEGSKIVRLHPAAFKDLTATSLHLNLISDSISLDRDIFLNLGRVKNLSLDLSTSSSPSNDTSAELANPANKFAPGLPFSVYLEELSLGSKAFPCTCSNIGWMGKWLRRHRAEVCPPSSYQQLGPTIPTCRRKLRQLRQAKCSGGGPGLLEQLHTELGCLSYNSSPPTHHLANLAIHLLLLLPFLHSLSSSFL